MFIHLMVNDCDSRVIGSSDRLTLEVIDTQGNVVYMLDQTVTAGTIAIKREN